MSIWLSFKDRSARQQATTTMSRTAGSLTGSGRMLAGRLVEKVTHLMERTPSLFEPLSLGVPLMKTTVLRAAYAYETATNRRSRRPSLDPGGRLSPRLRFQLRIPADQSRTTVQLSSRTQSPKLR